MKFKRSAQVGEAIQREISAIIEREINDPRIGFITVTRVDCTPDLRYARVYVSILGDDKKIQENLNGLQSAKKFVRKLIGERIRLRYTPEIEFRLDQSIREGAKIDAIMKELNKS